MDKVNIATTKHALEAESGPFIVRYTVTTHDLSPTETVGLHLEGEIYQGRAYGGGTPMQPTASFLVKWDGCTHIWFDGAFHFDEIEEWDALRECVRFIWEDLCQKHDVTG